MSGEELRPGWRRLPFSEIAMSITERVDDPSAAGVDRYVGLEHLDPESTRISRWGSPEDVGSTKLRFYPGDVVYGRRRAYQRKLGVADFEGICSAHALVLRARPESCLPEFLPYFLQGDAFHERALGISVGSLSPTINWRTLAKEEFVLPPLAEQQRITDLASGADAAVVAYERVASAASTAKQALRHELLSSDYRGTTTALGDAVSIALGRVYPSAEYTDSGLRLLRPGNIAPGGHLSWESSVWLPAKWADEAGSVLVAPGDVVMNLTAQSLEDGFLGRVCLAGVGDEAIMNQRIARLRSNVLVPEYLSELLQHQRFRQHVAARAKGSKIKHLYERDLKVFRLPTPPLERQDEVVALLQRIDDLMAAALASANRSSRVRKVVLEESLQGATG